MKNIKEQVYEALARAFGADHVTDQYPNNWAALPAVQYTEEDNKVYEHTDEGETKSYIRYRIDIWHNESTSASAALVDTVLGKPLAESVPSGTEPIGFVRTLCQDTPDPSGLKHKVMRYEGIIDMENDYIYWLD